MPLDPTALLAGPYTPPVPTRGQLYDALRHRWKSVTAWQQTTFGPWPSMGREQARPIVDEELLRAVETESATAVAHHWRVNVSTVIRWRGMAMADPRNDSPGTTRLHREIVGRPTNRKRMRAESLSRAYTPDEDAVILSKTDDDAAAELGRSRKAIAIRRWRLQPGKPLGRPKRPKSSE